MNVKNSIANRLWKREDGEEEGLQELNDRMKTLDSSKNDIYKFLGVKQVDSIKMKKVYNRVKEEI